MRESRIERTLVLAARARGLVTLKLTPQGSAGYPDRLLLGRNGVALFIEVKKPGERLRPLQEKRHADLRDMGFTCGVFDGTQPIGVFLDRALRECTRTKQGREAATREGGAAAKGRPSVSVNPKQGSSSATDGVSRSPLSFAQTKTIEEACVMMLKAQELMRRATGAEFGLVQWNRG